MSDALHVVFVTEPNAWHVEPWLKICASHASIASVTVAALADEVGTARELSQRLLGDKLRSVHSSVESALDVAPDAKLGIVTLEPWRTPPACTSLLSADCHVIYEKPGSTSVETLRALVALASERRRHLMMAFSGRAKPHLRWVRQAIEAGQIGDIWSVDARFVARDRLALGFREQGGGWLFSHERGGGGFLTFLGCHTIDTVAWLTGQPFIAVAGFTGKVHDLRLEVEDTAAFAFRLRGGAFGSFLGGYNLRQDDIHTLAIYGSEGWFDIDVTGTRGVECFTRNGPSGCTRRWREDIPPLPAGQDAYWAFGDACFAAALGRGAPPVAPEDGLRMLEVAYAVYDAAHMQSTRPIVMREKRES